MHTAVFIAKSLKQLASVTLKPDTQQLAVQLEEDPVASYTSHACVFCTQTLILNLLQVKHLTMIVLEEGIAVQGKKRSTVTPYNRF